MELHSIFLPHINLFVPHSHSPPASLIRYSPLGCVMLVLPFPGQYLIYRSNPWRIIVLHAKLRVGFLDWSREVQTKWSVHTVQWWHSKYSLNFLAAHTKPKVSYSVIVWFFSWGWRLLYAQVIGCISPHYEKSLYVFIKKQESNGLFSAMFPSMGIYSISCMLETTRHNVFPTY